MTNYLRDVFGGLWYVRGAEIVEVVIGILSIPTGVNPARFILLNIIEETSDIPTGILGITGFAISMIAMVFIGLGETAMKVFNVMHIIGCALLTFILPAIIFLKVFGKTRPAHFAGAILMNLVGVAFIVIALYEGIAD
jgi:ABC-type cobalamin transport system permease subunit